MHAVAAFREADHGPIVYQVERWPLPPGTTAALADGIVVVPATADPSADFAAARNYLNRLGLLDCACCGLEKDSTTP